MKTTDCARNIKTCALKGLLAELALNADDDREMLTRESWGEMLDDAVSNGDELYDYDGPLT